MTGPSNDPIIQQLQLLLTGYGYNFYSATNQARADDLLVRERASYFLAQAVDMLANLRGAYQRRFVPPLTRENPLPPAEALSPGTRNRAGSAGAFERGDPYSRDVGTHARPHLVALPSGAAPAGPVAQLRSRPRAQQRANEPVRLATDARQLAHARQRPFAPAFATIDADSTRPRAFPAITHVNWR